jgi:transposase
MPPSLEQRQDRQAQHRLAVLRNAEEVTGNVARTCRYYGISRPTFYKWLRRYQDEGIVGLRDRSSAPHHCPHATHADIVNKIVYLRQNYHFGPVKIQMYLTRYRHITITSSAIYNILVRLGLNRLPASQRYQSREKRWKRYEKPLPGNRVQIDVKFIEPNGPPADPATGKTPITGKLPTQRRRAKYYQLTAIDDCTRLRVLRIYPRCDQKTAVQFLDYVLQRLPFRVEVIQTDIQRRRVPDRVSLARTRQRHRAHLHQAGLTPPQRQGGALTPHRRRRVLPDARRCRHRRHRRLQRQAPRMGGLLQLPPPTRRPRRPDTLRAPQAENPDPGVNRTVRKSV